MNSSVIISFVLHAMMIFITAMSLPFLTKKPLDIPPIVSVELIQIAEKTNIPYAPKAKKTIENIKEKEKKLVSNQAPPKKIKKNKTKTVVSTEKNKKIEKEKPKAVPLPEKTVKKIETKKENKQNPEKVDTKVKQVSEFEKEELVETNVVQGLIDKAKEKESAEVLKKNNQVSQDQVRSVENIGLSYSEKDALKAQLYECWTIPIGMELIDNPSVRIKVEFNRDGTISKSEILDHARMNMPGQGFYKALAESALRAMKLCQPLRVPSSDYEKWKEIQFNFDASTQLQG